jgi:hypothetical protein
MIRFVRLMELAGQPILLENLTPSQAKALLVHYGVPEDAFHDDSALKSAWKKVRIKNHPDRGGNLEVAKQINAAYDVLKASLGSGYRSYGPASADHDEPEDQYPIWAQAGYSGGMRETGTIHRQNYTDMNFIKKKMWELSGKSKTAWTLWGFDGTFFRNTLTVYGSPQIFAEMGRALKEWQTKGGNPYQCRAVLANRKQAPHEMYVIWVEGCNFNHMPVESFPVLTTDSANMNPGNDQNFARRLPALLDTIQRDQRDRRSARVDAEDREWTGSRRTRNGGK